MRNDYETGMIVFKLFSFLFVWAPFFVYPQIYAIFKLTNNIKWHKNIQNFSRKKIYLYYAQILVIFMATCILHAFVFIDEPPFLLQLAFYVFVLPIYMVILALLAGMGKAFEAGFSARRFLETLNVMQQEKDQPNPKIKADENLPPAK